MMYARNKLHLRTRIPLDLQKALAGELVVLRNGQKAQVLADISKSVLLLDTRSPLIVMHDDACIEYYRIDGHYLSFGNSEYDLICMSDD